MKPSSTALGAQHGSSTRRLGVLLRSIRDLPTAAVGAEETNVAVDEQPEMRWGGTKEQMAEFFVLHNGQLMQEKDVKLSRQDADGFVHGCFDTTRTFGGVPFRMEEHVARLFQARNC